MEGMLTRFLEMTNASVTSARGVTVSSMARRSALVNPSRTSSSRGGKLARRSLMTFFLRVRPPTDCDLVSLEGRAGVTGSAVLLLFEVDFEDVDLEVDLRFASFGGATYFVARAGLEEEGIEEELDAREVLDAFLALE